MTEGYAKLTNHTDFPSWNGLDVLLITLGCAVLLLLGIGMILFIQQASEPSMIFVNAETSISLSLLLGLVETFALSVGVYLLGMLRRGYRWSVMGFRLITKPWIIGALAISIVAIPLTGLITFLVLLFMGQPLENPQIDFLLPKDISPLGAIAMMFLGGTIIPFAEELYFRGVLYPWLRKRLGFWLGALINGLLFGFAHLNIAIGTAAFVLGLILALSYEYSKSLWVPFLIHAIHNSTKILLLYLLIAFGLNINF